MKKLNAIFFVLLALQTFSLTSCEKEKPFADAIIGKWEVYSRKQISYENDVKREEYIMYYDPDEMSYQFVEGGSGIYSEGTNDYLFSWTLSGTELTISNLYQSDLVLIAAIDGDTLTWSYKTPNPDDPTGSFEFVLTARRIG